MKNLRVFIAVGAVVLIAFLAAARSAYYVQLDNDGMRYGLVADQILLGKGLRKPVMFGHIHWDTPPDAFGTIPYASQSPLLPALFAVMGGVRPGRLWPGQVLNVCAHVISSLFSFIIARRLAGNTAGVAAGIIVAVSYPLLRTVGYLWSDSLFIALFMVTIGLLQASRGAGDGRGYLLGSSVSAAAAFAARGVGVALVLLFFWEAILSWKRSGMRSAVRTILLTLPIPLFVVAAWWTRNFLITGTIRGAMMPSTGRSWAGALLGFMDLVTKQYGIYGPDLRVALVVVLLGIPCGFLIFSRKGGRGASRLWQGGLDLVLVAAACYAGVLASALAASQPQFELRFAAPLVPLISIAAVAVVVSGWKALGERGLQWLATCCMVGSLVFIGACEAVRSFSLLPRKARTSFLDVQSDSCRWAVSQCEPGSILVTNAPCMVTFFSGIPTLRPPYRGINPFVRIPPNMDEVLSRKMKEVGARYLLLLEVRDGLPEEEWGEFVAALSRREGVSDKLTMVRECPLGVVYKLNE